MGASALERCAVTHFTPSELRRALTPKRDVPGELITQLRRVNIPEPVRELRFAKSIGRQWRFDLAWPEHMLAVECDGATFARGRHTRGKGYEGDCEKGNAAVALGWRVLHYTTDMVEDGRARASVQAVFAAME